MSLSLPRVLALNAFRKKYPLAKTVFAGVSGISLAYGVYAHISQTQREALIEFQKQQLTKPIYELREGERQNPPWTPSNLNEWLYRPVRVKGRPLHYLGMYIPRIEFGKPGYEYVVPLVTKEDKDGNNQEGLLLSLGFIPYEYKEIPNRFKLEDASEQTFDCFVSQLPELQDRDYGNVAIRRKSYWNYADLELMAKFTGFLNTDAAKRVVLERCAFDTPLSERNMRTYDLDADHHMDYPYVKSRSGALYHKGHMPWDWQREKSRAFGTGLVFGSLSLLLHLAK